MPHRENQRPRWFSHIFMESSGYVGSCEKLATTVMRYLNKLEDADVHHSTIKITQTLISSSICYTVFYRHTKEIQCND